MYTNGANVLVNEYSTDVILESAGLYEYDRYRARCSMLVSRHPPATPNRQIFLPARCTQKIAKCSMMRHWRFRVTNAHRFAPGPTRPSRPRLGHMGPLSSSEKHFALLPIGCAILLCKSRGASSRSWRCACRRSRADGCSAHCRCARNRACRSSRLRTWTAAGTCTATLAHSCPPCRSALPRGAGARMHLDRAVSGPAVPQDETPV